MAVLILVGFKIIQTIVEVGLNTRETLYRSDASFDHLILVSILSVSYSYPFFSLSISPCSTTSREIEIPHSGEHRNGRADPCRL